MKKLLILSYHFPPFNVVASYRAKAYHDHLYKYGISTTIVTHPWSETNEKYSIEDEGDRRVIRVPRKHLFIGKALRLFNKLPIIRIIVNYIMMSIGYLDGNNIHFDFYWLYKKYVFKELNLNDYDYVMGVFSPYHHIKLCYEINKKYGIPIVMDFRDLHDNRLLDENVNISFEQRLRISIKERLLSKWIKNSQYVVSTSQLWADELGKLGGVEGIEVLNGFENEYFERYSRKETDEFVISSIGTIYENQDWGTYFDVINQFIKGKNDVKVRFVGLSDRYRKDAKSEIQRKLKGADLELLGRVTKNEVINHFSTTSVILFPSLKSYIGCYSGKTLELLASQVPILFYPDDQDVIADLIKSENAGYVTSSPKDMLKALEMEYENWKLTGTTLSKIDPDRIKNYSRENQVKKLANRLNHILQRY